VINDAGGLRNRRPDLPLQGTRCCGSRASRMAKSCITEQALAVHEAHMWPSTSRNLLPLRLSNFSISFVFYGVSLLRGQYHEWQWCMQDSLYRQHIHLPVMHCVRNSRKLTKSCPLYYSARTILYSCLITLSVSDPSKAGERLSAIGARLLRSDSRTSSGSSNVGSTGILLLVRT
jgi:hypothetical protein